MRSCNYIFTAEVDRVLDKNCYDPRITTKRNPAHSFSGCRSAVIAVFTETARHAPEIPFFSPVSLRAIAADVM
jgi:hypothetical protein